MFLQFGEEKVSVSLSWSPLHPERDFSFIHPSATAPDADWGHWEELVVSPPKWDGDA